MGLRSVVVITLFWGFIGIVLPFLIPKGVNRGIVQCSLLLTAATCYLFWLCCYLNQMNPLIGPRLRQDVLLFVGREWGNLSSNDIESYEPESTIHSPSSFGQISSTSSNN